MWKRIWTLFVARNKEFFRDRSSFGWNLLFPFLIIIGFSVVFNQDKQVLYKVGVIVSNNMTTYNKQYEEFKKTKYIEFIEFTSENIAIDKLKHHKVDMVISPLEKQYWVSGSSPKGYVLEKLLHASKENLERGYQEKKVSGREIPYVEWLFPGILGMNIMFSALFGVGFVVVRYRKNGVLKRLSVTPIKPYEFLTSQILSRMFILLLTTMVVYIGCAVLYGFETRGSYISLFLIFSLGGFSMISLALLVASRSNSEEFAGGVLNLITWPMMFLSEVWFSLEGSKPWIQDVAKIFPLTHMIDASRKIMNDGATLFDLRYQILAMTVMSVLFLTIGSLFFSWHKK